jgi:glycosyltransferase involved in cell wall biosynthesis
MRILLASSHRFPAYSKNSSGRHPKEYPSGSGYHLHDLLAKGLAEDGHEVFYHLEKGAETSLPPRVKLVEGPISEVDILHAPIGPPGFAEKILEFAAEHRKPCVLTCHMKRTDATAASNWVFVSRSLAQAHGSHRFVLNGIDPDDFIFSEKKKDYLLFMGAMNKAVDKGLDFALSLARDKGFRLVVAGTGLDYATIERVSELCAAAGAEYLGDVRGTEKAELIAGARAVLFPSRLSEGCPLVVLEAMVSGTPVVASPSGGTVEVVTPETGFLCHEEQDWRNALDRLDEISPIRCREIALRNYHYRSMVKSYSKEYQQEISDNCRLYSSRNSS